ncbi:hypothetical protein HAX54_020147, partial [Datura stramonium]|nr:hypothetical protein [Datura stramonium]
VIFSLQRTHYNNQETSTVDPTVNSPIRYGGNPTVITVSLQQISYRCSGPPKS